MGLAAKVFRLEERISIEVAAEKLRGWRAQRVESRGGEEYALLDEVSSLSVEDGLLRGEFLEDRLVTLPSREGPRPAVATLRTPFALLEAEEETILVVMAKKLRANRVASKLGEILLARPGGVFEAMIDPDQLRALHEANPESTRVIYFDQVDLPNVNVMALYGSALADTSTYQEYLRHGQVWYVVFHDAQYGLTVGVARNCVVTSFTRVDEEKFFRYVIERIVPLASESGRRLRRAR
ncbi:MAG: hypothetical protein DRO06_01900 [Thermoproteota archaeon]|nr:MAG: hypothetical protein DRO06_01900 [Candidatus Korarchaeota archaeon]